MLNISMSSSPAVMAPPPSALRGNLPASAERILHRPPMFEKHFKSSRNIQHKQLRVERRFSHYEQKVSSAPIDRCNTKLPRRLQTSKITRPFQRADEEKIKWNERLAAWLQEDKPTSLEYIKISDQFTPIEKQLYYCSACHEFFHLNLREREKRVACPRFKHHGEDHVRPVTIKKTKKRNSKRPPLVAKDPFGNRENLNIPALQPPKPNRRQQVKVVVDVPRLPSLTKTTTSENTVSTRTNSRKVNISPDYSSQKIESPELKSKTPTVFPNIFQSPAAYSMPATESPEETPVSELEIPEDPPIPEQVPTVEEKSEDVEILSDEQTPDYRTEHEHDPENASNFVEVFDIDDVAHPFDDVVDPFGDLVDPFDDVASNVASECCEVGSIRSDVKLSDIDEDEMFESKANEDFDANEYDSDTDIEFDFQSPTPPPQREISLSPSPEPVRPRPPPPDLPTFRLKESPDFIPMDKKLKPQMKRRQAMILPISKPEPKPEPEDKSKFKRMSKEEMARRMQRARAIDGYRRKFEFGGDEWTTTDDDESVASSDIELYDDSFLEKYCLVDPNHLAYCKKRFNKSDKDNDGYLTSEEVINAIHKMFSPKILDDAQMCYIFRILETTSFDVFADKMNLKLFAIVTSLAKKISQLDDYMKHLIGRVNIEVVDWKLCRARQLFEQTMRRDERGNYKVPMESLWLELHAGGISEEHERQARRKLAHMKELDLLDFLTYLPLFLLVHSQVVKNPLNSERHI